MIRLFTSFFGKPPVQQDVEATLDHVEPPDAGKAAYKRRSKALARAAAKYGKPWKCGPAHQSREVLIKLEGAIVAAVKGQEPAPPANVRPLKRVAK